MMRYPVKKKMSEDEKVEYFVPSPFCIPLPYEPDDDFMLPSSMVEQILSKRLRHHRPYYHLPPLPEKVLSAWSAPPGVNNGSSLLIYRQHVFLQNSTIVHDYMFVKKYDSYTGWAQKNVAYYYTEPSPFPYDEIMPTALLDLVDAPPPERSVPKSMSILSCCSKELIEIVPLPPPVRPRMVKRTQKPKT